MSLPQKRALISPKLKIPVIRQCFLLGLSRSSWYYRPYEPDEKEWMNLIADVYAKWPHYGYRKITVVLKDNHFLINTKKVRRLMKLMGLRSLLPKPRTSIPVSGNKISPPLSKTLILTHANQVWGTDITYLKLPVGFVYLFCLIDWYSRFIVGWKLAVTMEAEHALEAFYNALKNGCPEWCNADQGGQFTGEKWISCLTDHGVFLSHTGVGRCLDNIQIERFWWTLKYEDVYLRSYETVEEARAGIGKFIKYYNEERPHQALSYKTPFEIYFGSKAPCTAPSFLFPEGPIGERRKQMILPQLVL